MDRSRTMIIAVAIAAVAAISVTAIVTFGGDSTVTTASSPTTRPKQPGATSTTTSTVTTTTSTAASTTTTFSLPAMFTGTYSAHGFVMTVLPNGQGQAWWRTYTYCDQGASPPCDSNASTDQATAPNFFAGYLGGGNAAFTLNSVSGSQAIGTVTTTNQPSVISAGQITLTYEGSEQLSIDGRTSWVCGPGAPYGNCGA